MDNSNLIKNWEKWHPKKIFLKDEKDNQTFLYFSDKLKQEDFDTDIKNDIDSNNIKKNCESQLDIKQNESYKIGFKKGFLKSKNEYILLKDKLNKLFLDFEDAFLKFEKQLYPQLLKTILTVSSYVIGKKIDFEEETLLKHIKKIVHKNSVFTEKIELIVHPDNKTVIEKVLNNLLNSKMWKLLYDKNIDLNGCKLKSENIYLDATINARWQELNRLIDLEEY